MPTVDYSEVTRLVRAAFEEYKRIDSEGNADTFNDFVDDITGGDMYRFMERRIASWPRSDARARVEQALNLHRALGASLASLMALMPEPETTEKEGR